MGNEVKFYFMSCERTEDEGADELYLICNGERIWNGDLNVGQFADLQLTRPIRGQALVDLFDEDWPDSDDFLGRIVINESEAGQPQHSQTFTLDEAHYTLHYKVREE
jgi:hypothetical protein